MTATAKNGDAWTGEIQDGFWIYEDGAGNLYESREVPAYRVVMDNATVRTVNGKRTIHPMAADSPETKPRRFQELGAFSNGLESPETPEPIGLLATLEALSR